MTSGLGRTPHDIAVARERLAWRDRDYLCFAESPLGLWWEPAEWPATAATFPADPNCFCEVCGERGLTFQLANTDRLRHCLRCAEIAEDWVRHPVAIPYGIALWNPWAWLIQIGAKWQETRSWGTQYRGWIAIYATKAFPQEAIDFCFTDPCALYLRAHGKRKPNDLARGVCIAIAHLANCVPAHKLCTLLPESCFGDYQGTRWAWIFDSIRPLVEPVELDELSACKQGMFPISQDCQDALYARALPATNPIVPPQFVRDHLRVGRPHAQFWADWQAFRNEREVALAQAARKEG